MNKKGEKMNKIIVSDISGRKRAVVYGKGWTDLNKIKKRDIIKLTNSKWGIYENGK